LCGDGINFFPIFPGKLSNKTYLFKKSGALFLKKTLGLHLKKAASLDQRYQFLGKSVLCFGMKR